MITSTLIMEFPCDIKRVWDLIVSLDDYAWRNDLVCINVVEVNKSFVEIDKNNISTFFEITEKKIINVMR